MSSSSSLAFEFSLTVLPLFETSSRSDVLPEILQAVGTAEKGREICRVDEDNISCALAARWHPQQAIEFSVACCRKGMRPIGIDRLPGEYLHSLAVILRQSVM